MVEKKTETRKVKKKTWFEIKAPKLFNEVIIGECLGYSSDSLKGRRLEISVGDLTGDFKRQNVKVIFVIASVDGEKLTSEVLGYKVSSAHLRKLVRTGGRKIEDSFVLKSKDGFNVRVKTMFLTRKVVQKNVLGSLNARSREILGEEFKKFNFDEIVKKAVDYRLQLDLKKSLKKVYPVGNCEFKSISKL